MSMNWTFQGVETEPTREQIDAAIAAIFYDATERYLTNEEAAEIESLAGLLNADETAQAA